MSEEGAVNHIEKRIRPKSKKDKKNEDCNIVLLGTKNIRRNQVVEHVLRSEIGDIAAMKSSKRKKEKKDEEMKYPEVINSKNDVSKMKIAPLYGENVNADAMNVTERNCRKRDDRKNENEDNRMPKFEIWRVEAKESLMSGKEAKKERKKQKAMRNNIDDNAEGEQEGRKQGEPCDDKIEANTIKKFEIEKKKRKRKNSKDCAESQNNYPEAMMKSKIYDDQAANTVMENENKSEKISEMVNESSVDNLAKGVKRKKKNVSGNKENDGDSSALQHDNVLEYLEGNAHSTMHDGSVVKKLERKKKKKRKKLKNPEDNSSAVQPTDIHRQDFLDNEGHALSEVDESHKEAENINKRKKKKSKLVDNGLNYPTTPKSGKKVSFSSQIDVFHLPDDSNSDKRNDGEENMVIGKRFTPEENEIVKEAVHRYIWEHDLGEDGLNMVLNCKKYPKLKGCWKEIAAAIPYRPYSAVYFRAQVLFRRSENRKWTQEEYDMVLKYQEEHGNKWRALADELGKHRWHVKDTWRRIKLPNLNKGQWPQEEYQSLFDLVNTDLQHRVSEEKRSKHGMLRDNICWTAISDKLSSRAQASCCIKWYNQLTSPMVAEGLWADTDDYRMMQKLYTLDDSCMEDVDWDNLLDHRSGAICRKRWNQMVLHIGHLGNKPFAEQVGTLAQRYCPHLLEVREAWEKKPRVP